MSTALLTTLCLCTGTLHIVVHGVAHFDQRTGLPPYASGWYALGISSEFPPGSVIARRALGRNLVVCRADSGRVGVFDAVCPHLGADLGAGGRVVGERIECPFHGFQFGFDGGCVAAYDDAHLCSGRLGVHDVDEVNGIVFLRHATPSAPVPWQIEEMSDAGWTPLRFSRWHLNTHPQEVHENAADVGHLRRLHGFAIDGYGFETDGEKFRSAYRSGKPGGLTGRGRNPMELDIDGYVAGLGFAVTNVVLLGLGLRSRIFTLTTPTDPGELDLTIAMSVRSLSESRLGRFTHRLPERAVMAASHLLVAALLKASATEVRKDAAIWQTKAYLDRPRLAAGDGPVMAYRRWASQFYAALPGASNPEPTPVPVRLTEARPLRRRQEARA